MNIFPPRGRVRGIRLLPKVEDTKTRTEIQQKREYHIFTFDSLHMNVQEFVTLYPEFNPGTVYGLQQVDNVELEDTAAHDCYLLTVNFLPYSDLSPFVEPIEWAWDSAFLEVPAYEDYRGRPVQTRSGEIITGLTRKIKLWVLRGTRKVPDVPKWILDYGYSVSKDRVKIDKQAFKPGYLSLQRLSIGNFETQVTSARTYEYRPMSMEIWFNPIGWWEIVPHTGYYELQVQYSSAGGTINSDGQPAIAEGEFFLGQSRCRDQNGEETRDKVFLNLDGRRPRDQFGNVKSVLEPSDITTLRFDLDEPLPYKRLVG